MAATEDMDADGNFPCDKDVGATEEADADGKASSDKALSEMYGCQAAPTKARVHT